MKQVILFATLIILVGCGQQQSDNSEAVSDDSVVAQVADYERIIYYTCPMDEHKHVHSDKPGKCTECDMALVPGVITQMDKAEYYGCPMLIHSHIRSEAPGKCAECGMELMPMRLVQ